MKIKGAMRLELKITIWVLKNINLLNVSIGKQVKVVKNEVR